MNEKTLTIGSIVTINNPTYWPEMKGVPLRVTGINLTESIKRGEWTYSVQLEHLEQEPNTYYATYSQFIEFVEPIELTNGWLDKFNFTYKDINGDSGFWRKLPFQILEGEDGYFYYDYSLLIKYVHQLQFLYMALMQKELILKKE